MTKRGILIFIALIFCFVSLLIGVAIYQSQDYRRDPIVLMNKYYQFKSTRPDIAEEALIILYPSPLKVLDYFSEMDYKHSHEISAAQ